MIPATRAAARPKPVGNRSAGSPGELYLDRIRNPFGPCPAALEAMDLASAEDSSSLADRLRCRIGETFRLPAPSIRLLKSADMGLRGLVRRSAGPVVVFPPSEGTLFGEFESAGCGVVSLARGFAKEGLIAPADASDIPPGSVAYIESPSDPLGQLLSPSDAVRLARACQWLVIDERYVEFSGQSLLALAADFENMIVVRSFEVWAALEQTPCAWAVIPPAVARSLQEEECMPTAEAMAAALATLDNLSSVEATLRLVREERSRLFRLMRKLSFLEPVPTWGPFLAARAVVVDRDEIVESLRHRRIHVYAPAHPSLDRYIRFGIGSRSEMDRLRRALLELAPALVA